MSGSRMRTHPRDMPLPGAATPADLVTQEAAHRSTCKEFARSGAVNMRCRLCVFYASMLAEVARRFWTPAKSTQAELRGLRRRPEDPARTASRARQGSDWVLVLYREGMTFAQAMGVVRPWHTQEGEARAWPRKPTR